MNLDAALKSSQVYTFWKWVSRRHEPEKGRVVLTQRRVYVLPTRHGISFALALVLMLIGSINYNLSLGYILTFLLAGMAIVSILHTFRNLAYLAVSPGKTEPVYAGDLAYFDLYVENERDDARRAVHFRSEDQVQTAILPGRRVSALRIPVRASHRGWLQLPRVTLETFYPLGMFRAWSYVQPEIRTLVYPKPDNSPLPPPRPREGSGDAINIGTGNDDFSNLRSYQSSDSPRHIAWKAVARSDTMLTKSFMGRASRELMFAWRDLPDTLDIEARLSRLSRWVLLAQEAGLEYGLDLPGVKITLGSGSQHFERCMEALALYEPGQR
jgi:uncharacterized protein (DUF58 family)